MIYAYEPLAYFYGMKPQEYWSCECRQMILFCEVCSMRRIENFKEGVIVQEAVTDKLIQADGMNKRPKVIPLKKMFKGLFG